MGVCFQVLETAGEVGDTLQDGSLMLLFEVNPLGWAVSLLQQSLPLM